MHPDDECRPVAWQPSNAFSELMGSPVTPTPPPQMPIFSTDVVAAVTEAIDAAVAATATIPAGPACTGTCERCKLKIRTMEYHDPDGLFCEPCHHLKEAVGLLKAIDKAFGSHDADEWYQEHYFTIVEDTEAFLNSAREWAEGARQ